MANPSIQEASFVSRDTDTSVGYEVAETPDPHQYSIPSDESTTSGVLQNITIAIQDPADKLNGREHSRGRSAKQSAARNNQKRQSVQDLESQDGDSDRTDGSGEEDSPAYRESFARDAIHDGDAIHEDDGLDTYEMRKARQSASDRKLLAGRPRHCCSSPTQTKLLLSFFVIFGIFGLVSFILNWVAVWDAGIIQGAISKINASLNPGGASPSGGAAAPVDTPINIAR